MTPSFDWDTFLADFHAKESVDLADDQRWSSWPETARTLDRGPKPFPDWVVQHDGAIDTELGILKTGKEADAYLIERGIPPEDRTGAAGEAVLMIAKRYRSGDQVTFHRSGEYADGRKVTDSRAGRAMARGTAFGKEVAALQWARTEFDTLKQLWAAGLPVPYPVQIIGTELCMEFVGTDDERGAIAAPRLQDARPEPELAAEWARQLRTFVVGLADLHLVHGDLSPYNILVDPRGDGEQLVVIDVPQVIDLISNPHANRFLERDCVNVCTWLRAHGASEGAADPQEWMSATRGATT